MMTRLAQALVGKYPSAWRERYEAEVQELLVDSPVRISDVFELCRGLIVERMKSLIEPAEHPTMTDWGFRFVAWLINIAPAVTLVVGGAAFGRQLNAWLGEPSAVVSLVALVSCLIVVAIEIGSRRIFRVELGRAFNLGLVLLAVVFIVTWHWARTPEDFGHWSQLSIWAMVVHRLLATRFPWRPMFDAVERYQAASEAVRHAQAEVNRCLASNERVAQWRLQPALETLAQLEHERDEARVIVTGYGYRARFRG